MAAVPNTSIMYEKWTRTFFVGGIKLAIESNNFNNV